jgi:hypothetical protein
LRLGVWRSHRDCVRTNTSGFVSRKWVEDSTRRESNLCSQGLDPRFCGDDTSVDFSHSLHPFGICASRSFGLNQEFQVVN